MSDRNGKGECIFRGSVHWPPFQLPLAVGKRGRSKTNSAISFWGNLRASVSVAQRIEYAEPPAVAIVDSVQAGQRTAPIFSIPSRSPSAEGLHPSAGSAEMPA